MKIKHYNEMMEYLTRPGFNGGGAVSNRTVLPKRKPAAPAYHPQVEEKINKVAEKIGFDKKLFSDLGDNISFQNSMRNFYSMPNTRVPNAQKSFALFCYGDMKSCKEGDKVQCVKNSNRYTNF